MLALSPVAVSVSSSDWHADFLPSGYTIPLNAEPLTPLPWVNLDELSIRFSEAAVVRPEYLAVTGVNVAEYQVGFDYDPATFTATWTLEHPIASDKLLLHLVDAVHAMSGEALDGDRDGNPGGDFKLRFDVQPGDVDGDGRTRIFDTIKTRNRQGTFPGDPNYSVLSDVDGSGDIRIFDTIKVRNQQLSQLPTGEPVASQYPLVELSSERIREESSFEVRVFRGPPNTPVGVDLQHDGMLIRPMLGSGMTDEQGKATLRLQMPRDLLSPGTREDGFPLLVTVGDVTKGIGVVVTAVPPLMASIPAMIQEGEAFRANVALHIGNTALHTDLLHDGEFLMHLHDREIGPDGTANVMLTMPKNLLPDGAREDAYQLRFRAGGLEQTVPFLLKSAPKLFVDLPAGNRIQEGATFTFHIAELTGRGNTQVSANLWHDGVLLENAFHGFKELGPEGTATLTYQMPSNLLIYGFEQAQDAFDLTFDVAGADRKTIRITVTAKPRLLVSYPRTIIDGSEFYVSYAQGFVGQPIGNTAVYADLWHDGVRIRHFPDGNLDGNGIATIKYRMVNVDGSLILKDYGGTEDTYQFRFRAAGLPEREVSFLLKKGPPQDPIQPDPIVPIPAPKGAPSSPAPVTPTVRSTTRIDLSWRNSTGEDGYKVYRWTGSTWQEIGSVGRDVTSFSATGLSPGTRHHFKVRAFNADAAVDTDTVSAMTPDSPVGLIGTLTAAPKSGKRIDLTWSNAANADGYRVYIRGSNGVWERLATLGPNTAAYSVRSGLEKNTEYRFRVEAFNRTQVVNSEIMAKTLDWDHRWLPGIYVIAHKAALEIGVNPFYHSALLIVADSIDGIENISNNNVDEALKEKGWVTLGAQPQTFFPPFGKLIKQQDFPGDHPSNNLFPTPLLTSLGGRSLTTVIDNLLAADNRYNNNLDYDAVPGVRDVWSLFDGYNSNSYVSGLLRKVGLSPPLLPVEAHRIPGYYGVPVPASHFD